MTGILADIPTDLSAEEFIGEFDRRLDRAVLDAAKRATADPWDTLGKQLIVGASQAWGETRSAETFARQILKLRFDHPELKAAVGRQLHEEMNHFMIFQDCFNRMGVKDILKEIPPEQHLMDFFDYCDHVSDDILESIFFCQFCTERGALHLFREIAKKPEVHPELRSAMTKINQDEPFHVSIGRMAARALLCRKGEGVRRRMIALATESLPFTLGSMEGVSLRMVTM
jgi:hypothetical protein